MKTYATTALLMLVASAGSYAQEHTVERAYIGANYRSAASHTHDDERQIVFSDKDSVNSGQQLYGGYRLLRYFALESRVSELGDYQTSDGGGLVKTEFAALTGNAVGILPFGRSGLELYGQLGAGMVSRKSTTAFPVPEDNENSAVGTAGLGLRYTSSSANTLTVTAGYDTYIFKTAENYSDRNSGQSVTMAKVGLQYSF
jgi:hypothetical protein